MGYMAPADRACLSDALPCSPPPQDLGILPGDGAGRTAEVGVAVLSIMQYMPPCMYAIDGNGYLVARVVRRTSWGLNNECMDIMLFAGHTESCGLMLVAGHSRMIMRWP